jgi:uncharacterized repeat protein (TIGR01451 family)
MASSLSKIKFPKTYLKGAVLFTICGLLLGQIISPLSVYALPALHVDLSVSPSSGPAPLNNVDFTATVSGTATGDVTYKFDCASDGSWERTKTTSSTSYTATDLCSYSSPGNYTAKISVERGGLVFYGTTAIFVSGSSDLSVNLYVNPSSGPAPLLDVDLTATVSGSASGDITYKFDCTNNGTWERTATTSSTSYTATDLCDYSLPGNYTAKVSVERGGLTFQGTTAIAVFSGQEPALAIQKLGRNITQGQTSWQNAIDAKPGEVLEFQIKITSIGGKKAENIIVSDILPDKMTYLGDLRVNGQTINVENIGYGINIGDLSPNQTKTIVFKAKVDSEENFGFGITTLVNTGVVRAKDVSSVTNATQIQVRRAQVAGAATTVSTGAMDYLYLSLIMVFVLSLGFYLLFQGAEHSQNKFLKRILRKYYLLKLFILPR